MRSYLKFLSALAANNSKEWMDDNKKWYLDSREEFIEDVAVMLKGVEAFEPAMATFKPKDCIFRINRDVRFSANKNPYKNNFSAYFSAKGKKVEWPGYYVHVQPGASFIGGGLWMPSSHSLKKIRREIDYSGAELKKILESKAIAEVYTGIEGEKLKTSPRDYDADHEFIEFLKLKSFILSKPMTDQDINSGNFINVALDGFQRMKPFQEFLSRAIEDVEDGSGIL